MRAVIFVWMMLLGLAAAGQSNTIRGEVIDLRSEERLKHVTVLNLQSKQSVLTDHQGEFSLTATESDSITISAVGYLTDTVVISSSNKFIAVQLKPLTKSLEEVVISGTMREIRKSTSPIAVESYSAKFFKKNVSASVFESLSIVNGVQPQLNCNVCNTGDIHINGMEGPYTMVLIDGMPVVSNLATVYGFSGIPASLIKRVEIVKGPSSTLYGSEAVAGLINIITKDPSSAALFHADVYGTSYDEINADVSAKFKFGKTNSLLGLNLFNFGKRYDVNGDNFTDVTLQKRVSLFNKWDFKRNSQLPFQLGIRLLAEDRWGGEMQWNKNYRGGSEIYGESIYTSRWEILGKYQLPTTEKMFLQFSLIGHDQNSVYGNSFFLANQKIAFGQYLWDKNLKNHSLLFGTAFRYQYYDDNTPATNSSNSSEIYSLFIQDEIQFSEKSSVLLGSRYDYNSAHGSIFTPRLAVKWKPTTNDILRLNFGTGFRIVNLFTEDHQALSGSRDVILTENLKPETSYNLNLNYLKKYVLNNSGVINLEFSAWHTYFTNKIFADYDVNPNQIVYDNLNGYSKIFGLSINADWITPFGLKATVGASFFDAKTKQDNRKFTPLFTEKYTVNWAINYEIPKWFLALDYTGNLTGNMRLPLLGELDPRREYSLPYSIQNIQITYKKIHDLEIYSGIKNLLNWTPNRGNPFIISRSNDPFDKNVQFDTSGNVIPTADNPYGLTFDPTYAYGPNQGIRFFLGLRYHID